MKNIKLFLVAIPVLFMLSVQAQTVDEIVNRHIEAIGGKEKLSQVKSLYIENSLEVGGNQSPEVEYLVDSKGFKTESEFNGMKIINCYTDKGGWLLNPFFGSTDPQPMPDEVYKAGKNVIYAGGALLDYAAKGNKVELIGKENNNYKIKVTSGGAETTYFIDTATYYINKTVASADFGGQNIDVVTTFSDYKKTDFGIVLPYSRTTDFGNFALAYTTTKVEVNKEIDPKIFEMGK